MRVVPVVVLVVLVACGKEKEEEDGDGDGFRPPIDCDDTNSFVYPGQDETCNGVDDNCDQRVDEDVALPWYPDTDGDGFGDASVQVALACVAPAGFVSDGTDCDDTRADVNPSGTEDCSAVDMNCDGDPINDAEGAWYVDDDGDGWGVPDATPEDSCDPGPGWVELEGDCDDDDSLQNPDAAEVCNDEDDDCDEEIDDGLEFVSTYQDADLDGFGAAATETIACSVAPGRVTNGADCADLDATSYPGAPERCDNGVDNDCDALTDDDDSPEADTWYTDVDADGHGNPTQSFQACDAEGASLLDDDCDDADATSFPGNNEFCDGGIDNDCDATTDEALTAIWYRDLDGDGFGIDSDTFTGCSPPAGYTQIPGDCDDADPSLNPTLTPNCEQLHCGTITTSQTWKSTVTHLVTCDVVVGGLAKPVLTVNDGTEVRFAASAELRVATAGEGKLVVNGDVLGVLFTSAATFPIAGDWDGLVLGEDDLGSRVVGLTVEYGGRNGEGGITVDGGSPTFDRLTSRLNLGDGLYVSGSEPLVHDSFLVDNTDNGLFVDVGAGLARTPLLGGSGPSFTDNELTGNGGRPITIPGSHADEIALSNTLVPNQSEEIALLAGALRFTGTWFDHDIPYVVADNARIDVEDGPQAVLTVEDGVDVFFGTNAELTIGDGAGGRLLLEDGPDGILFSATDEVIALSANWKGVTFGADDDGSEIQNLVIEYGGANARGNLYVKSSAPLFDGVTSRLSDSAGLYVSGTTAAPEIRNSDFVDNDQDGVFIEATSGIARSLLGPTFVNNLLTSNGESSIVIPPGFIGELDPSTQFSGNNKPIRVHGGDVVEDALWRKLDEDYQIQDDVDLGGPQDPVLEIEDGVVLLFDRDTELTVGIEDDGALLVDAPVSGVTMTSSDPAPGEGDWDGLQIGRNGGIVQTKIRGLTIAFAGGSDVADGGAIELRDENGCSTLEPLVDLDDVTILASSKAGLYAESRTQFSADGFTVSGNLGHCWEIIDTPGCASPEVRSFNDNDCQSGAFFGIWPFVQAAALNASSTFPGPVLLEGNAVSASMTVPALPVPYRVEELVRVNGAAAPVLTLSTGARMEFGPIAGLEVGNGAAGALVLQPGVVLTSDQAVPAAGDWLGVRFAGSCRAATNLNGATISFAGGNTNAGLWLDHCLFGTYNAMTITDSSNYGLYVEYNEDDTLPAFLNFVYARNASGDAFLEEF